ncbi:unnamed protein product [Nippostrongylus brasiliensis]|uniref:G_PROTEIN_RECEP_F1_2 domain-containing protein n=1 Tax=Nippostrongylus brasiliensis TaxID=27835 RepID=A0A0N4YRX6_NIPBR|nr:unnamed protein product [Nippostrongylus brasiliensis]
MSVVVAIDRLLVVRKATNSDDGFPIPIKIGLIISVVYCVGFLICLATFAEVTYSLNDGAWGYGSDHGSVVMSDIEFVVSVACIVTTFVIYLLIIASIYKMKQGVSMKHGTEMQLFANATILFVILVTLLTCWHYYQLFLPDTLWTVFAINVYWMLYCGAMPFLSILFTRSTRMSYLRLLRLKPVQRSTVSIIRSKSMVR